MMEMGGENGRGRRAGAGGAGVAVGRCGKPERERERVEPEREGITREATHWPLTARRTERRRSDVDWGRPSWVNDGWTGRLHSFSKHRSPMSNMKTQ